MRQRMRRNVEAERHPELEAGRERVSQRQRMIRNVEAEVHREIEAGWERGRGGRG